METTDLEYQASEISRILDSGIEIMPNSPIHLKLKQALALLSVGKSVKEKYTPTFEEWRIINKYKKSEPFTYRKGKEQFTPKQLIDKYRQEFNIKP